MDKEKRKKESKKERKKIVSVNFIHALFSVLDFLPF